MKRFQVNLFQRLPQKIETGTQWEDLTAVTPRKKLIPPPKK